jgi:hypothetical protein
MSSACTEKQCTLWLDNLIQLQLLPQTEQQTTSKFGTVTEKVRPKQTNRIGATGAFCDVWADVCNNKNTDEALLGTGLT